MLTTSTRRVAAISTRRPPATAQPRYQEVLVPRMDPHRDGGRESTLPFQLLHLEWTQLPAESSSDVDLYFYSQRGNNRSVPLKYLAIPDIGVRSLAAIRSLIGAITENCSDLERVFICYFVLELDEKRNIKPIEVMCRRILSDMRAEEAFTDTCIDHKICMEAGFEWFRGWWRKSVHGETCYSGFQDDHGGY